MSDSVETASEPSAASPPWPRGGREVLALVAFLAACFGVAALGALATGPAVSTWYRDIEKPPFNPPAWVFGPTWTVLYALMAWAAFLAWRERGLRSVPLGLFFVQLALNGLWSPVFFGLQQLGAAFGVILALWIAILLTLVAFWRVRRLAGALLVPYLAWVSFAAVLNAALWRLNPQLG